MRTEERTKYEADGLLNEADRTSDEAGRTPDETDRSEAGRVPRIKLCGLKRDVDIETANRLRPEYIGFVFAKGSCREVTEEQAAELGRKLLPKIQKVGVFVREDPQRIVHLLERGIIDIAQLHGGEDEEYISRLREMTDRPIIKAFRMDGPEDVEAARTCTADYVLLDSGVGGTGTIFDWTLVRGLERPFFLAGGLSPENVAEAVGTLEPFAVDVSSGIETDGRKDPVKMDTFVQAVRSANG